MNILILGGGGREHALAWKLRQSPRVREIFCAPGNGGIGEIATLVPLRASEPDALVAWARDHAIDLTVVGPDDALAAGIVDRFQAAGLRIFGPTQAAARLESSKAFAKDFMHRHGIPTARSATFDNSAEAREYVRAEDMPLVLKADGLALGKGVIMAASPEAAAEGIREIMEDRRFGEAGRRIVIEETLVGIECSLHALVDRHGYLLFPGAQDHKRAYDGDQGPNTGGMGAFSPPPAFTPEIEARVRREILDPFVAGLLRDGLAYNGMLFPGLMLTAEGPKVLEFNCRFGDPETQVLLPRLTGDLLELLEATIDNRLAETPARWSPDAAVCVVLASGGYPGPCTPGDVITGLDSVASEAEVFHAGTRREGEEWTTAGGRVLGITAMGAGLSAARRQAYAAVEKVFFAGRQFRTDIAARTTPE